MFSRAKKSIFDIITELPCLNDLENPDQLPVQEVLEGTDDCVLWIFKISSLFMFSRVRNPFLIFLLTYHVWVTSKIQVNFRYRRYLKILLIVSYRFLKLSPYLCFRGRRIHFWYCYLTSMLVCPRKSRSTSGTGGTDDSVLWIFEISSVFMFSRSRNPLLAFLLSYRVRVTLKIQVNFRFRRYWWFCLMNFWNFSSIYVFEVKESIAGIPTELPCSGDLENPGQLPVQEVLMILSYEFLKFLQYLCFRGQGIHCWHSYWATLFGWPQKTPRNGSWPRFSRSPARGSSVGISAMDSLTLET